MKAIITLFISMCIVLIAKSQTGELQGRVYDAGTNEGIPFAPIVLMSDGMQKAIGITDENGNYTIKPVLPGSYDLIVQYIGYRNVLLDGVNIFADRISFQNVEMQQAGENGITAARGNPTTSNQDNRSRSAQSYVRDANCTPVRSNVMDQNAVAASDDASSISCLSGAAVSQTDDTPLIIASSSEIEKVYYIDGCRIRGSMIPAINVEDLSIITGGIPARYENASSDLEEFKNLIPAYSPYTHSTNLR